MILPQWLDVHRLPPEGVTLEGQLPLAWCERLAALLAEGGEDLHACLRCLPDAAGRPFLRGVLSGRLSLQCQRCLEPMSWPLRADIEVLLADEDSPAQDAPETVLLEEGRLNLWQALEDEALLALPFSPRHEQACPQATAAEPETGKVRPFAALAQWRAKT